MGTNRNKQPSDRRILAAAAKALLALSVTTALLLGFSLGPVEGLSLACALLGAMVGLAFHLSVRKAPQEDSPKEPTHAEEPAPSTEPAPTKGSDPADLAASASVPSESSAAGTEPADKQEDAAATSNAISAEVTSVEDASAEASR